LISKHHKRQSWAQNIYCKHFINYYIASLENWPYGSIDDLIYFNGALDNMKSYKDRYENIDHLAGADRLSWHETTDYYKTLFSSRNLIRATQKIHQTKTCHELMKLGLNYIRPKSATYNIFTNQTKFDPYGKGKIFVYGIDDSLMQFYYEMIEKKPDPVIELAYKISRPFWMSDVYDHPFIIDNKHKKHIKMTLNTFGDSLFAPLYGPDMVLGFAFITFENNVKLNRIQTWNLHAMLNIFHAQYAILRRQTYGRIHLTPREQNVLILITQGKTNREIGETLGISMNTVSGYMKQIFIKLDTHDRVSTAMRAQSLNLISS